jgi:nucleoid-associated protein YgaU
MTRETKIGLLVGLAFIIVIGILLSDHLTQSTEPQPAVLAIAGNSVRSGITVPGVTGNAGGVNNPPITQVPPPTNVQPTSAVPTRDEVTRREPPVQIVQVGAPTLSASGGQSPQQTSPRTTSPVPSSNDNVAITPPPAQHSAEPATPQDQSGGTQVATQEPTTPEPTNNTNQSGPIVTQTPQSVAGAINNALKNAAKQAGEDLVSVGGSSDNSSAQSRTGNGSSNPPPVAGTKYVAAEGDTLNKLAGRFLGGNTKVNRDAIMAANPFMKGDPNRIIVGRTYIIPTAGAATPAPTGQAASAAAPPREVPPTQAKSNTNTSTAATESWYTVKEGDSLWKIATDQCGGPSAIDAIKELNKDTLKGGDTVVVNTKLRLPSKPVASAN